MDIDSVKTGTKKDRRQRPLRRDTLTVLIEQLTLTQKIGQWLANETHGDAYVQVRELNEHFHQAQRKLRDIQSSLAISDSQAPMGMELKFEYRPG